MSRIIKTIFSRMAMVGALLLLQLIVLIFAIWELSSYFVYFYIGCVLLSIAMVLYVLKREMNPSVKIPWIMLMMILPLFGGLMYVMFGRANVPRMLGKRTADIMARSAAHMKASPQVVENAINEYKNPNAALQMAYLSNLNMEAFENTEVTYLSPGERKFSAMLEQLEKAESFIFLEYFILQEGKMWDTVLEVLERKAEAGVDVRVMYDDMGCLLLLPMGYAKTLGAKGIKTVVFNPFRPTLTPMLQNRDHRKILVIDGKVGFTGGINIADEYINAINVHGHWKDASVMLKGDAVWGLTLMFLQNWNFNRDEDPDFEKFHIKTENKHDGYVQPYFDTPFDSELVGETVYLNMINSATKYLYIETPYFIVDHDLMHALGRAAKRGVDVRVVTPHKGDKWYVHTMTQDSYSPLIEYGVKVYEYTPGFLHSKIFVCDDIIATVGTVNMDYRSLYHHFECGALLYQCNCVMDIRRDFDEIIKVSQRITVEDCNVSSLVQFARSILRLIAPLL